MLPYIREALVGVFYGAGSAAVIGYALRMSGHGVSPRLLRYWLRR